MTAVLAASDTAQCQHQNQHAAALTEHQPRPGNPDRHPPPANALAPTRRSTGRRPPPHPRRPTPLALAGDAAADNSSARPGVGHPRQPAAVRRWPASSGSLLVSTHLTFFGAERLGDVTHPAPPHPARQPAPAERRLAWPCPTGPRGDADHDERRPVPLPPVCPATRPAPAASSPMTTRSSTASAWSRGRAAMSAIAASVDTDRQRREDWCHRVRPFPEKVVEGHR